MFTVVEFEVKQSEPGSRSFADRVADACTTTPGMEDVGCLSIESSRQTGIAKLVFEWSDKASVDGRAKYVASWEDAIGWKGTVTESSTRPPLVGPMTYTPDINGRPCNS